MSKKKKKIRFTRTTALPDAAFFHLAGHIADYVIETGEITIVLGVRGTEVVLCEGGCPQHLKEPGAVIFVPDVLLVEAASGGIEPPESSRLVRGDGRSVSLFGT